MSNISQPYKSDPYTGTLSTPITNSNFTKAWLISLPIYRKGLSPILRGLEIGMAHGYFLIGPFYKLGPLRNSEYALLASLFSAAGLILILTIALNIYGIVTYKEGPEDELNTSEGWNSFTSGFFIGAMGGCSFVYLLLMNSTLLFSI